MCSKLTAHGEKLRGERERSGGGGGGGGWGGRGEKQATGISFYGNHHLAHSNKLPSLLKQRKRVGWQWW